jgi:hypothetical protein
MSIWPDLEQEDFFVIFAKELRYAPEKSVLCEKEIRLSKAVGSLFYSEFSHWPQIDTSIGMSATDCFFLQIITSRVDTSRRLLENHE